MKASYQCIKLHDVGDFVPAKAHKSLVILRTVPLDHYVGLKVCLPFHLVRCSGSSPFGVIGWGVTFGPNMVPASRNITKHYSFIFTKLP